jgi:hypothetical protein
METAIDLSISKLNGNILSLCEKMNELETMVFRLVDVNRKILDVNIKTEEKNKLSKDTYKISEVSKLTGLSKSTLRNKVNSGEISIIASSSVGVTFIPKSEVERLVEFINIKPLKPLTKEEKLEALAQGEVDGLSLSRKLSKITLNQVSH